MSRTPWTSLLVLHVSRVRLMPVNCAIISLGLGIYADWIDTGAGTIDYYLDDMAIFDIDDGVTIDDVLAWQGH